MQIKKLLAGFLSAAMMTMSAVPEFAPALEASAKDEEPVVIAAAPSNEDTKSTDDTTESADDAVITIGTTEVSAKSTTAAAVAVEEDPTESTTPAEDMTTEVSTKTTKTTTVSAEDSEETTEAAEEEELATTNNATTKAATTMTTAATTMTTTTTTTTTYVLMTTDNLTYRKYNDYAEIVMIEVKDDETEVSIPGYIGELPVKKLAGSFSYDYKDQRYYAHGLFVKYAETEPHEFTTTTRPTTESTTTTTTTSTAATTTTTAASTSYDPNATTTHVPYTTMAIATTKAAQRATTAVASKSNSSDSITREDCTQVVKVVVPDTIEELSSSIFRGLSNLQTVELPDTLQKLGSGVFASNGLKSVTIPKGVTAFNGNPIGKNQSITDLYVDPENPDFTSKDGVIFTKDMTMLVAFPPARTGSYTIPRSPSRQRSRQSADMLLRCARTSRR